jgi:hypothetical protein
VCLYLSTTKIWPYIGATAGGTEPNKAKEACEAIGLNLALIKTEDENKALQEMASKCFVVLTYED